MNITVTHTLAPEILALIQGAIGLAGAAGAVSKPIKKQLAEPTTTQQAFTVGGQQFSEADRQQVIESANKHLVAKSDDEVVETKVTVEQVRLAVNEKKDTHKVQIKALLNEFGVASVSALLPANRADFLAKVNAL